MVLPGADPPARPYHFASRRLFLRRCNAKKEKLRRNLRLLRQRVEEAPDDLRAWIQCLESAAQSPDLAQYARRAVEAVQKKCPQWEIYGGCILCHTIEIAQMHELPELDEWIAYTEKEFSKTIFVQIDLNYLVFLSAYEAKDWEKAIRYGKACRKGFHVLRAPRHSKTIEIELERGSLLKGGPASECTLLLGLADAYAQAREGEQALRILSELEGARLDAKDVRNAVLVFCRLHAQCPEDVAPVLTAFYEQISREAPSAQMRQARLAAFHTVAAAAFTKVYRKEESEHEGYRRPAYTAFAALAEKCEAGRGAAVMMAIEPAEMREWLAKVEDWQALPIEALEYALWEGVAFPLPEKPLPIEVLDGLAARLTQGENLARQMTLTLPENAEFESLQGLFWARSLAMAALRSFDWSLGKNSRPASKFACPEKPNGRESRTEKPEDTPEAGLALLRRFAALESAILPLLYAPQALTEENAALLPPLHRWGLFCTQALEALDAGRPQEYLAILRKGLAACPGQKELVQFLLDRFREDARPKASPELLALAEKVRAILAATNPDDPAARAIRESDAYKQVAWLMEETPGLPVQ